MLSLVFATLLAPAAASADACPPNVSDFDTWTWLPSWSSGDSWVTNLVCATPAKRDQVRSLVRTHLGLDENNDYWSGMMSNSEVCNPNQWGGRVIGGGYATELVGIHRDNDTLNQTISPGGILPDGTPVKFWLSQYASYYISEEGYDWECLADGDAPGPDDGFTFASNPASNSACTFYFPWFWNKTVMDRASTVVHEATHEFAGHISDSACTNGASCDDVFMNANAQSFQIIFDAQAVDAYRREAGSRELDVVNFGNGVCGYLPLLPDQDRFALVQVMISKLKKCFQTVPPASAYPASAVLDSVPGTIWDLAGNPGGQADVAYRIDIWNGARWPCGQVCQPSDFTWNPNGASGPRACNETWQAGNAAINQANRNRCNMLNGQLGAGVTKAEYASLVSQAQYGMQGCIKGVSQEYLDSVCDDLIPAAQDVGDIESAWPLDDNIGYGYDPEEAILGCQTRFCGQQNIAAWDAEARGVCYEWDDAKGCMDLLCGDLAALDPDPGRASQTYLEAVICRASELGRAIPGVRAADVGCSKVFNDCIVRERYLPLWENQLAGDDCWSDSLPAPAPDPFFTNHRRQIGELSWDRFAVVDRGPGLMVSSCALEEAECEAFQAAMRRIMAKIMKMKTRERFPWQVPPGPDPWEHMVGRFDREFSVAMGDLSDALDVDQAPLYRDAALRRASASPDAQVAMADLIGHDTFLRMGGARFADRGIFNPARLAQFGGPNAERDPHGLPTDGFEDEIAAFEALGARLDSRQWFALRRQAPQLGAERYYGHLVALLNARSGVELKAAHDALQRDLQGL
ncbi:MAG: hypothetical protein H6706_12940 [Myxococcales bacterium]|nr:hypothetical protein [Myxococcales bacterium]